MITEPHSTYVDSRRVGEATVTIHPHVMHRADWEAHPERQEQGSPRMIHLRTLVRLGRLDLIGGDREIAPDVTNRDIMVFTHHRFPAWGHIGKAGAAYHWQDA